MAQAVDALTHPLSPPCRPPAASVDGALPQAPMALCLGPQSVLTGDLWGGGGLGPLDINLTLEGAGD